MNGEPTPSRPILRRSLARTALAFLAAPALWLMNLLARRSESLPENSASIATVPLAPGDGIRFYDRAIVVTNAGAVSVFSPVCPHLGCRINRAEGAELVCPCHGSRFDARGRLLRGPASRSLQPLAFERDATGAFLRVSLRK